MPFSARISPIVGLIVLATLTVSGSGIRPAYAQDKPASSQAVQPEPTVNIRELALRAEGLFQSGDYAAAEPLFLELVEVAEQRFGRDSAPTIAIVGRLVLLYTATNRPTLAEPHALRVLRFHDRAPGQASPEVAIAANNLAEVYEAQGRFELALPLFERAYSLTTQQFGESHPESRLVGFAMADTLVGLERFDAAETIYQDMIRSFDRDEAGKTNGTAGAASASDLWPTLALVALGNLQRLTGRPLEAETSYERAIDRAEAAGNEALVSHAAVGLARVYRETNRTDLAVARAQRAYDLHVRTAGTESAIAWWYATEHVQSLLSPEAADRPSLTRAAQNLRSGLAVGTPEILTRSTGFLSIIDREISPRASHSLYADAAWQLDPGVATEAVFEALQHALVTEASEAISQMAARFGDGAASSRLAVLARQRMETINALASLQSRLVSSLSGEENAGVTERRQIAAELESVERRLNGIESELQNSFPDYFTLIDPQPVEIVDVQAMLGADEAILLTVPSEFGTHVMAITSSGMEWHRSDMNRVAIDDTVRRLRWDLGARVSATPEEFADWQSGDPESGAFPFDRQAAFRLYQALVAPVESTIGGRTRLYIVAGGQLAALPFSVLVTEMPQGADHDPGALRETAWLADRHALASIPSIRSLQLLRQVETGDERAITPDFAGFGDPVLQGEAQQRGFRNLRSVPSANSVLSWNQGANRSRMADVAALSQLTRLPGTATELENIRAALGASADSIRLAERATETAVRTADLSDARIIAFATHGLVPEDLSFLTEPGLVFTPPATATDADDGYLSASEVTALNLNADWVILSACNTATGEGGAGLSSLARSFFYAGARNLLASHWPVDDQVASRMTVRTFEILRDTPGLSRAEAFQQAMREVRMDPANDNPLTSWAHPAFWAPFVLIGSGS